MPAILYVLFLLSVLPIMLAWLAAILRYRELGIFDNKHPRLAQARQTGMGARALGAERNSWETLQVFTLVTLIAHISPLPIESLTAVSILFLVLRLVYVGCYLAGWGHARSAVYTLGMFCCLYIFALSFFTYHA